jgi:hypothetical protein
MGYADTIGEVEVRRTAIVIAFVGAMALGLWLLPGTRKLSAEEAAALVKQEYAADAVWCEDHPKTLSEPWDYRCWVTRSDGRTEPVWIAVHGDAITASTF